ncbi:MAG: endonuclease/exonuclease/phosphatase family protein [Bacteroidota bacterium]|nr:endonuclease/exonuclease/phosphatase family protein [Bacteroidota bacterium]
MKTIARNIFKYINYIVIAALLLSYLSVFVSPEKIWFLSFFGLAYPFLLITNIIFIFFWLYRKKKLFLFSLIAILLGWNNLSSVIQTPLVRKNNKIEKNKIEKKIKIISFNVRLFDLYKWTKSEDAYIEIINFIHKEAPDVICFQEFYTNSTNLKLEKILNHLKNTKYHHIEYSLKSDNNSSYGIATLSKYPIIEKGKILYKNTTNLSIYSDIRAHGKIIRIFNNHLQSIRFKKENYYFLKNSKYFSDNKKFEEIKDISFRLKDAFAKRAQQADILSKHIKNTPYPTIVCGDFNDTPLSYTYHKIKANLNDAFVNSGSGLGTTYTGSFPSYRIDYFLYSDDFNAQNYKVPHIRLSDHFPIICEFVIK